MVRSLLVRVMLVSGIAAGLGTPAFAQTASSITVRDGTGTSAVMGTGTANSKLFYGFYAAGSDGSVSQPATAANQTTGNTALGTLSGTVSASGSPATTAQTVQPGNGVKFDTVVTGAATDRGLSVTTAGTAQQLMAANPNRRGYSVQVQTTSATCYINGQTTATSDFHSLMIANPTGQTGAYYDTPANHVGTGAVSIVCSATPTLVYSREW